MGIQTVKAAAVVAAGVLLLSACSTNKEETPAGGGGGNKPADCDTSKGTLVLGVITPLTGELSALGLGIRNSADLAVRQANEKCTVPGYTIKLQAEDDQRTPTVGAQAATKLASTPEVIGVISTLNSNVSQAVQPILDQAGIVQISPANTNDTLTKGDDFKNSPKRKYPTYFRTCTVDSLQGPFAANYMVKEAGKKKIAIVTNGLTYGEGLADEFSKQAEANGAEIVFRGKVGEKDVDFSGQISAIKAKNPDAVYAGMEYPQAGPLSKQLASGGVNVPVMGGDGIYDPKFINLGGKDGDLATSVGAPVEELPTAKEFTDAYNAEKEFTDPWAAYGAFSYDGANAILASLGKVVEGKEWSDSMRADLVKAVGEYKAKGATGDVAFDEFGDSTNKVLTVYSVKGGKWDAVKTGQGDEG